VILGTRSEQGISESVKRCLNAVPSILIIDLTGKTSVSDVIDIIGNAKLVVANDSSGVHIAAATRTPVVATVGGWLYGRFLPYHIENHHSGEPLPLEAHATVPCFRCKWVYNTILRDNSECLHSWERDIPCICIEKITYEQMEELVDRVIDTYVLC